MCLVNYQAKEKIIVMRKLLVIILVLCGTSLVASQNVEVVNKEKLTHDSILASPDTIILKCLDFKDNKEGKMLKHLIYNVVKESCFSDYVFIIGKSREMGDTTMVLWNAVLEKSGLMYPGHYSLEQLLGSIRLDINGKNINIYVIESMPDLLSRYVVGTDSDVLYIITKKILPEEVIIFEPDFVTYINATVHDDSMEIIETVIDGRYVSDILVSTDTTEYYDSNDLKYYNINYSITNFSNENYYTWVCFGKKTDSAKSDIRQYFYKRHGDFSLINLMTDNVFFIEPINACPIIGKTFLKRIAPNSTFTYKILTTDLEQSCYEDWIRTVKESDFLELVPLSADSSFYYIQDEIILTDAISK